MGKKLGTQIGCYAMGLRAFSPSRVSVAFQKAAYALWLKATQPLPLSSKSHPLHHVCPLYKSCSHDRFDLVTFAAISALT